MIECQVDVKKKKQRQYDYLLYSFNKTVARNYSLF